jgi:SNF2 family DNA or RNA helicase
MGFLLHSVRRILNLVQEFKTQPEFLQGGTLHPYQLEGLNWLLYCWHEKKNALLADEMGFVNVKT